VHNSGEARISRDQWRPLRLLRIPEFAMQVKPPLGIRGCPGAAPEPSLEN
jgi:hypothetical protein